MFLDEGGNLDFTLKGSAHFTLTSVIKTRPFLIEKTLLPLKFDMIESGIDIEYFHASEDRQYVRNQVFECIQKNITNLRVDSVITEKRKLTPSLQIIEHLYPFALGLLLKNMTEGINFKEDDKLIVITDTLPLKSKRRAIEKGIKTTLKQTLGKKVRYRILHHSSKSAIGLQIADYCNWAVFRKWERNDSRSYNLIASAIHKEAVVT
ncbi:hypothetical protein BVX94_00985 [bacterium B17]|nr:hypothetical protein BVX94_00985 [bacterium B17]